MLSRPWLGAAAAGAMVPVLMLGVYALSPPLRDGLRDALFFAWPFCDDSLQGAPVVWVASSGLVFWGLGGLLAARAFRRAWPVPHPAATLVSSLAVALGLYLVPLLATIWAMATAAGQVAGLDQWIGWAGNHGPWRHLCQLRYLLSLTFLVPALACVLGVLAFVARPSWAALSIAGTSAMAFWLLISTHYWLID